MKFYYDLRKVLKNKGSLSPTIIIKIRALFRGYDFVETEKKKRKKKSSWNRP